MKKRDFRTEPEKGTEPETTNNIFSFNTGDKTMKKTDKKAKAGKDKAVRISLAQQTADKAKKSKTGFSSEVQESYNLYQQEGSSYRKSAKNRGIHLADSETEGKHCITLDSFKACQEMNVTEYDSPKKRRGEAIDYIKKTLGKKLKAGTVIRWKGRNSDNKAGNLNTCAKYFFSNVKSTCTQDCKTWNHFALTSLSEKPEKK